MLEVEEMILLNQKKVNFKILPGEILQLQGKNGVGKSLFLKSLARIFPSKYQSLRLHSRPDHEWKIEEWRRRIIYLPNYIFDDHEKTIEAYLYAPFKFKSYSAFKPDFDPSVFFKNLKLQLKYLSTGERQYLMILRSLMLKPDLLLLDETMSNMDESRRQEIIELIKSWSDNVRSVVIVSHFSFETHLSRKYCLD